MTEIEQSNCSLHISVLVILRCFESCYPLYHHDSLKGCSLLYFQSNNFWRSCRRETPLLLVAHAIITAICLLSQNFGKRKRTKKVRELLCIMKQTHIWFASEKSVFAVNILRELWDWFILMKHPVFFHSISLHSKTTDRI